MEFTWISEEILKNKYDETNSFIDVSLNDNIVYNVEFGYSVDEDDQKIATGFIIFTWFVIINSPFMEKIILDFEIRHIAEYIKSNENKEEILLFIFNSLVLTHKSLYNHIKSHTKFKLGKYKKMDDIFIKNLPGIYDRIE